MTLSLLLCAIVVVLLQSRWWQWAKCEDASVDVVPHGSAIEDEHEIVVLSTTEQGRVANHIERLSDAWVCCHRLGKLYDEFRTYAMNAGQRQDRVLPWKDHALYFWKVWLDGLFCFGFNRFGRGEVRNIAFLLQDQRERKTSEGRNFHIVLSPLLATRHGARIVLSSGWSGNGTLVPRTASEAWALRSEPVRAVTAQVAGHVTALWTRLLPSSAGRSERRHRRYEVIFA